MTLAPLTSRCHTVRKLAFTTPVREAGGGGRWVTLHAQDSDEGTCHVFIGGGSGPGSGTITKGPKGLLGAHIAALASHPSVSKAQHHPVGHEPPGAKDHPHYAEAPPNAERPSPNAGPQEEPAKRPGKPYARLTGAEQGTRAQAVGRALSEAQGAARGAKAAPAKPDIAALERAEKQARSDYIAASTSHRKNPTRHEAARQAHAAALKALQDAQAGAPERRAADTAVAHQQAQTELAAHRAKNDRNPNPWAPHLSPPVGDAKDRELAEKATRAQLAHQAAQAQAQGAQQQQQTAEQRAHEKEMVRLKAERAQQPSVRPAPHAQAAQPQPRRDEPIVMPDGSTRTRDQYDMAHAVGKDAADRQMRAAGRSTWNEEDYNVFARTMNDHLERNLTMGSAAANRARTKTKARESASPAVRFIAPAAR